MAGFGCPPRVSCPAIRSGQRLSWLLRARLCVAPGPSACVQLRPTLPSCRVSLTTSPPRSIGRVPIGVRSWWPPFVGHSHHSACTRASIPGCQVAQSVNETSEAGVASLSRNAEFSNWISTTWKALCWSRSSVLRGLESETTDCCMRRERLS